MTHNRKPDIIRIFSFDIGPYNMGASIIDVSIEKPIIQKLDRRAVPVDGLLTPASLIEGVRQYVTDIIKKVEIDEHGGVEEIEGSYSPDMVLIEQQVSSPDKGINLTSVKIQTILHTIFRERFSDCVVKISGASARLDSGKKGRAKALGFGFLTLYSAPWFHYLLKMEDPQHTCDAITMTVDNAKFQGMVEFMDIMFKWEQDHPAIPKPARVSRGASRGRWASKKK